MRGARHASELRGVWSVGAWAAILLSIGTSENSGGKRTRSIRNTNGLCGHKAEIIIINIEPLGRSGQRPELGQATGVALVGCILGKFLGVVFHCFPPRLNVPTFATRCPHVRNDARDPSGGRWNCGREYCPVILPK
jgi:hypothetical protein